MKDSTKKVLLTGIVAGILGASAPSLGADAAGKCMGANSCGVEGKNGCAGEGFTEATKADCLKLKAKWSKSKDEKEVKQAKKIKWEPKA